MKILKEKLYDLTQEILREEDKGKENIKSNRRRIRKLFKDYSKEECLEAMENIGGCFDTYVGMIPNFCRGIDCDECYSNYVYPRLMYWKH